MHELLNEFGLMFKAEELRSWGIVQEADLEKVDENFLCDPKINLVTKRRLKKMKAAWDARKTALVEPFVHVPPQIPASLTATPSVIAAGGAESVIAAGGAELSGVAHGPLKRAREHTP
jgi:hypothetical protein